MPKTKKYIVEYYLNCEVKKGKALIHTARVTATSLKEAEKQAVVNTLASSSGRVISVAQDKGQKRPTGRRYHILTKAQLKSYTVWEKWLDTPAEPAEPPACEPEVVEVEPEPIDTGYQFFDPAALKTIFEAAQEKVAAAPSICANRQCDDNNPDADCAACWVGVPSELIGAEELNRLNVPDSDYVLPAKVVSDQPEASTELLGDRKLLANIPTEYKALLLILGIMLVLGVGLLVTHMLR
jgi:hypothetical protein